MYFMIGQIISHYKILEKLGKGGMGVVYKAEDTKLKRIVALKFLPKGLEAHELERARFLQEAQAASALNHPNVCTIYDIKEEGNQHFIVMEYVDGVTLREKIAQCRAKSLFALQDVITYAIQIGEALQEAHSKGIVHRDVKPENIMVNSKNQVKVMDFGLAKLKGSMKLTRTSSTVGTLAYMAPEQIQGGEVDARSDVFSFGIVLYEMLTGHLPFRGEHEAAMVYSIVDEEPQPISSFRLDVPSHITSIVLKTLQKDPTSRYQTIPEMIHDLKSSPMESIQLPKEEKSIVVLPFANLSSDPDQEYFSDGLTEEVISDLSVVRSLRVISRSSAMTFKGTKKIIPEIARQLNVQYVLEGSVRKAANNLRITAQLIDAMNDAHLWAEKYSGTLDDVFDIQEKVSRSIVNALKLKLTPKETERLTERPIPSVLAYEFYLKARQEILKWTEAGLENALRYLQDGIEIAEENALLYAGMAYVYFQYFNLGLKEEEYCRKQAEAYRHKSFTLDPDCSLANFVRGMLIAWYQPIEGIKCFKRVLDTNPNDFDTLFFFSCLLGTLGRKRDVVPLEERTIKIDPLNPAAHFHSGFNRLWEGEYTLALEVLSKLHRTFPGDVLTKWSYGLSLAYMDKKEEAGLIFEQIAQEQPGTVFGSLGLAFKYALAEKRSETLTMLDSNPCLQKPLDFQFAYWKTECFALIGEKERALDWLEQDVNLGMINYPLMNTLDPFLANIRDEGRFKKLMERVKKEWEEFEV
jgi:eukaryotic-like serine/threonine-protein kinase